MTRAPRFVTRATCPCAFAFCSAILFLCASTLAQFGPPGPAPREERKDDPAAATAKKAHEENVAKYGGDPDYLVLPGLRANRKDKSVRIWGKMIGLDHNDPIEFFLIPPDSGKDYEALAVGYVKPSDVHEALEFVGVKPGRPVDYMADQYWPKGERVLMTYEWEENGKSRKARAEELIIDTRTGKPLPVTGLIFTGSYLLRMEGGAKPAYAADVADPRSIASDYNDRGTVLDVPRSAPQGNVYGFQKTNPAFTFARDLPVQIVLQPEYKDGKQRVRDVTLKASVAPGKENAGVKGLEFSLTDAAGTSIADGGTLVHMMAAFGKLTESGHDAHVTIDIDDSMPLRTVREFYEVVMSMDVENGIRVEPPPEGHLFYRAFFPDQEWRDRENRLGRPWEFHVTSARPLAGTLILPADDIDDNEGKGDLKFPVKAAEEMARTLAEKSDRWSQTVYVFTPETVRYGEFMSFIRSSLKTHSTVYVFLNNR
jgi:hypothetical protein